MEDPVPDEAAEHEGEEEPGGEEEGRAHTEVGEECQESRVQQSDGLE